MEQKKEMVKKEKREKEDKVKSALVQIGVNFTSTKERDRVAKLIREKYPFGILRLAS